MNASTSHPTDSAHPQGATDPDAPTSRATPRRVSMWLGWIKRFGVAGFFFFLIKGLLWLAAPGLIFLWGQHGR
jgi:hypothetical protein